MGLDFGWVPVQMEEEMAWGARQLWGAVYGLTSGDEMVAL